MSLYVLVTLDVRNAFNTASRDHIDAALGARSVPQYLVRIIRPYIENRFLSIRANEDADVGTKSH